MPDLAAAQGVVSPMQSLNAQFQTSTDDSDDYGPVQGAPNGQLPSTEFFDMNFNVVDNNIAAGNNLTLMEFQARGQTFGAPVAADRIFIRRRDNAEVSGERDLVWHHGTIQNNIGSIVNPNQANHIVSLARTMEEALLSRIINRGADNTFANASSNSNNVERVDFVFDAGVTPSAATVDAIGFLVLESAGNDDIGIAAITEIDGAGNPTAFGPYVFIDQAEWGRTGPSYPRVVARADDGEPDLRPSASVGSQTISGVLATFADLGVQAGDTIFGYSLFPGDVDDGNDLVGLSDFPTDTPGSSNGGGGADLIAGGSVFRAAVSADLAVTKTDGQAGYTSGETLNYSIVASNDAGSADDMPGTRVVDTFDPAFFDVDNVTWTCSGADGGSCANDSGSGDIDEAVDLPVGGRVTFTVSAPTRGSASGELANTAEVLIPDGVTDPDTDNNSATDTNSGPTPQSPFVCNETPYLSQAPNGTTATTLFAVDTRSNPLPFNALGDNDHGITYNALGYNPADDYIYALQTFPNAGDGELIRVGSDGSALSLGAVDGLPAANYLAGDFDTSGQYYVKAPGTNATIHVINVASQAVTQTLTLSRSVNLFDFSFVPGSNALIGVDRVGTDTLIRIDPATGTVTTIGGNHADLAFGATFAGSNGTFFGNANNGSGFFQFNLDSGARIRISDSPGATVNDGAHCADAPISFPADLAITKDDGADSFSPGTDVVYDIVVGNADGPFGVVGARVEDVLPEGTTGTWTCTGANGGRCETDSGSGDIDELVDLPVGASVTFELTLTVPPDYSEATLENSASVAPPDNIDDPDADNNSATDTNGEAAPDLSITKDDGQTDYTPGGSLTYTIVAANAGPADVSGVRVIDNFDADSFDVENISWTCAPATESTAVCGEASGTGNIDQRVDIPAGESVVFTVSAPTQATASADPLVNTARIAAPDGVVDPDTDNNSFVDSNARVVLAEAISLTPDQAATVRPCASLAYRHVLRNTGTTAEDVVVAVRSQSRLSSQLRLPTASDGGEFAGFVGIPDLAAGSLVTRFDTSAGTYAQIALADDGAGGLAVPLEPGDFIEIQTQVFAPCDVAEGTVDVLALAATVVVGTANDAAADTTTVSSVNLQIRKQGALDAACNNAPGAFASATVRAEPNQCVIWELRVQNNGVRPLCNAQVFDAAPDFTAIENGADLPAVLDAPGTCETNDGALTCRVGTALDIDGDSQPESFCLRAGEGARVRFRVRVQ